MPEAPEPPTSGQQMIDIHRVKRGYFEETLGTLGPPWYEDSPEQMPHLYKDQPHLLRKADG